MSKIAEHLSDIINKNMHEHGIVVWYDPEETYRFILDKLKLSDYSLYIYSGSFFKLRYEIESFLRDDEAPRILIYLPIDRNSTHDALIEAETAGCYMDPEHPQRSKNTRMENVAAQVLKKYAPDQVDTILKKIQNKEYTLEDIDQIAASGYSGASGSLKLVYDKSDPLEILFSLIVHPEKDSQLLQKNALEEIHNLIKTQLGFSLSNIDEIAGIRAELVQLLLLNDFLFTTKLKDIPEQWSRLSLASSSLARKNVLKVVETLKERNISRNLYIEAANKIEKLFQISENNIPTANLETSETFPIIDNILLQKAFDFFIEGNTDKLSSLVEKRNNMFWGRIPPFNLQWQWLNIISKFVILKKEILNTLKKQKWNISKFIQAYTTGEKPWYMADQYYTELEIKYDLLDSEILDIGDILEKSYIKIQNEYLALLRILNEKFQDTLIESEFDLSSIETQREIFSKYISPAFQSNKKIAYIQVDAFRFNMGASLAHSLEEDYKVSLTSFLAQLPTITQIGMAAALPDADQFLSLGMNKDGKIGLQIKDTLLISREDRKNYLEAYLGSDKFCETKLSSLKKPKKIIRESIKNASFIWITSQEIDLLGENIQGVLARKMMEETITDLRRAVLELIKLGVDNIFITADHGYLFHAELSSGDKIDAPGGKQYLLHRRAWIGYGGAKHPSYIRINENQLGLSGDLELVFPRGIACFKSPGGNEYFYHGGISLQEMVLPLIVISPKETRREYTSKKDFRIEMDRSQVTNRFFVIKVIYEATELFLPSKYRVHINVESDKKEVGEVVTGEYGFDPTTKDIEMENLKTNAITIAIKSDPPPKDIDIILQDNISQTVLSKLSKIPVKINI